MRPFRKNVAIAIDGGGIRGILVTRALAILEEQLGTPLRQIVKLVAGTSTGSVIAAGIAAGIPAEKMFTLYTELGKTIFKPNLHTWLWPLSRYRYPSAPLEMALRNEIGDLKMGNLWNNPHPIDVVLTTFDIFENRTRFIKPWKAQYQNWLVTKAVLSSCAAPSFFPVVEGRYIDGGVGTYSNPCYLAAYELLFCLRWEPAETTLISLGTGRCVQPIEPDQAKRMRAWQWLEPMFGAFMQSADDQQVHFVNTFFHDLDFRRFQVNLQQPIAINDVSQVDELTRYGDRLAKKILHDEIDYIQNLSPHLVPGF